MINLVTLLLIITTVKSQIYSNESLYKSSSDLIKVIKTEENLITALKMHLDRQNATLYKLYKTLEDYQKLNETAQENPEKFVENPVQIFTLINKMTVDWEEAKKLLENNSTNKLLDSLEEPGLFSVWPSKADLTGAGLALLRVQDLYDLKASDLANGTFNGVHRGGSLDSSKCKLLSDLAYNDSNAKLALEWGQEAAKKL